MVSRLAHRDTDDDEKPTLGYWHIRGTASPIRYILVYLGVDY